MQERDSVVSEFTGLIARSNDSFLLSLSTLFPAILFCFLWPLIVYLVIFISRATSDVKLHELVFFSTVSLAIAYLTQLSVATVMEVLLPSLIILLTFLFQLFVRARGKGEVPLGTFQAYASASTAVVSFIVNSSYLRLVLGVGN
jgi:hypothetical protein